VFQEETLFIAQPTFVSNSCLAMRNTVPEINKIRWMDGYTCDL